MEKVKKSLDLGTAPLYKLLLKFSIPCVVSLLIGALYNIVDQIFIGNSELGYLGNAATGVAFPVICIANACAWCIGNGASSYLSICAGRKDIEHAHKTVGTGITASAIVSIILTIICLIFTRPLMKLFGASANSIDMAVDYFTIIASFFPFYLLYNVFSGIIRADGSPAYAMIAMLTGAAINVILDPIFIFVLHWGIKGAAYATIIGQVASFIICAIYFFKPKQFKLHAKSFIPDRNILFHIIKLGGSTFVTQISIVVVTVVCNITLAKYGELSIYGPDIPMSVFAIQTKVYTIVCNIVVGIVLGAQPIFGYNYGAKKFDRVKKLYLLVFSLAVIVGITSTLVFQLYPEGIINLFGSGDALYLEFAKKTFKIYLSLIAVTCLIKMSSVFFQSIGKPLSSITSSIIRDIILFAPLAIILPKIMENNNPGSGINGLLYAAPIADAIAVIVIIILTITFFASLKKMTKEQEMMNEE